MSTEKHILPQFPLSIVVYPGEQVNLHIFEPRYVQLINECYETGKSFGIPPFHKGEMSFFGTELDLLEVSKKYEDGKMDIKTIGNRVYQVHKFEKKLEGKLYSAAQVSFLNDEPEFEQHLKPQILNYLKELFELLQIKKPVESFGENFKSYSIAHHVGLGKDEKIRLLTMRSENKRLNFILDHLQQFLPAVKKAEYLKERASLNGHFKTLRSPDF